MNTASMNKNNKILHYLTVNLMECLCSKFCTKYTHHFTLVCNTIIDLNAYDILVSFLMVTECSYCDKLPWCTQNQHFWFFSVNTSLFMRVGNTSSRSWVHYLVEERKRKTVLICLIFGVKQTLVLFREILIKRQTSSEKETLFVQQFGWG